MFASLQFTNAVSVNTDLKDGMLREGLPEPANPRQSWQGAKTRIRKANTGNCTFENSCTIFIVNFRLFPTVSFFVTPSFKASKACVSISVDQTNSENLRLLFKI